MLGCLVVVLAVWAVVTSLQLFVVRDDLIIHLESSRKDSIQTSVHSLPSLTNVIVSEHGVPGPVCMNVQDYLAELKAKEMRIAKVIQNDVRDGINSQVRNRELEMRRLVDQFHSGMSKQEVISRIGPPHTTHKVVSQGKLTTITRTYEFSETAPESTSIFTYWPRVGVPFDGRNGQGYWIVHLHFGTNQLLDNWSWSEPAYVLSGSGETRRRQAEHWDGSFEISSVPP